MNYFGGVQYLNPIYALPTRALAAELAVQAQPGDLILAERDTLIGYYSTCTRASATYQDVIRQRICWIGQHNHTRSGW